MSNETFSSGLMHASANEQVAGHPAGEIRLPGGSSVGRRAGLLAGLVDLGNDASTVIETVSMSLV